MFSYQMFVMTRTLTFLEPPLLSWAISIIFYSRFSSFTIAVIFPFSLTQQWPAIELNLNFSSYRTCFDYSIMESKRMPSDLCPFIVDLPPPRISTVVSSNLSIKGKIHGSSYSTLMFIHWLEVERLWSGFEFPVLNSILSRRVGAEGRYSDSNIAIVEREMESTTCVRVQTRVIEFNIYADVTELAPPYTKTLSSAEQLAWPRRAVQSSGKIGSVIQASIFVSNIKLLVSSC